ncbi:PFGI-1 class ICE element type IV pilus protein PilL2 [Porticoccus sp. GXU_MW_L64]
MNNRKYSIRAVTIMVGLLQTTPLLASDQFVADGRYTTLKVGATTEQTNLLDAIIRTTIPNRYITIGQGLAYLVKPYGFRLSFQPEYPQGQSVLLSLPLPQPLRSIGPITVSEAIRVFGGESYTAHINPVTRKISYQLKDTHKQYVSETDIQEAHERWKSIVESLANKQPPRRKRHKPAQSALRTYGPVEQGETLGSIVRYFQWHGLTLEQALVETARANPDAFTHENMNNLRVGVILNIPDFNPQEALPVPQAETIVEAHYQQWIEQQDDTQ